MCNVRRLLQNIELVLHTSSVVGNSASRLSKRLGAIQRALLQKIHITDKAINRQLNASVDVLKFYYPVDNSL